MNLYLLLEGKRTEAAIYPAWLASLDPPFTRLRRVNEVSASARRSFFCFSANGYPSIITSHLINAVKDVQSHPGYDWLVVCLDVDESTSAVRIAEVERNARAAGIDESPVRLFVVPQARCIESWLLGYRRLIGASPPPYVAELRDFHDVRTACPEAMGHPRSWPLHAPFHFHYLREAFKARRMLYSKANPGDAATSAYFQALRSRVREYPSQMPTLRRFLEFVDSL